MSVVTVSMVTCIYIQDNSPPNAADFVKLPELSKNIDLCTLDHRDFISQAILERISIFTSLGMILDTQAVSEMMEEVNNMDEKSGGSGPTSLNSLSLSFPQQMSLSSSASGSGEVTHTRPKPSEGTHTRQKPRIASKK